MLLLVFYLASPSPPPPTNIVLLNFADLLPPLLHHHHSVLLLNFADLPFQVIPLSFAVTDFMSGFGDGEGEKIWVWRVEHFANE